MPRTFTDSATRQFTDPFRKPQEHLKGAFTGTQYEGVTYTLKGQQNDAGDWEVFVTPRPEPGEEFFIGWVGQYNTGWSYKLEPTVQQYRGFARDGRPGDNGWAWVGKGQGKTRREAVYLLFSAYTTALAGKLTAQRMATAAREGFTFPADETYLYNLADGHAWKRPVTLAVTSSNGEYAVFPVLDIIRTGDAFKVTYLTDQGQPDGHHVRSAFFTVMDGKAEILVLGGTDDEDKYPAGQRRKAEREARDKAERARLDRLMIERRKANAEAREDFVARVNDWMDRRMTEREALILAALMRSNTGGLDDRDDWTVVAERAKSWHETGEEARARWDELKGGS